MNESDFHRLADAVLAEAEAALEAADAQGLIELEAGRDMLTVELGDGRRFILSKHNASMQVWLSSPVSGGLHFRYDDKSGRWALPDGRALMPLFLGELKQLAGV
jgi:iron donor protein CyaY